MPWKTSSLLVTLVLLPAFGCAGRGEEPGMPRPDALIVDVSTDRSRYAPGEPIAVELVVRNAGPTPVTLEFSSSQRYDLQLIDAAGETAWTWSASRGFLQVLGTDTLAPGERRRFVESVDVALAAGTYRLRGMIAAQTEGLHAETTLEVR